MIINNADSCIEDDLLQPGKAEPAPHQSDFGSQLAEGSPGEMMA
jgi:hypothetical protein